MVFLLISPIWVATMRYFVKIVKEQHNMRTMLSVLESQINGSLLRPEEVKVEETRGE